MRVSVNYLWLGLLRNDSEPRDWLPQIRVCQNPGQTMLEYSPTEGGFRLASIVGITMGQAILGPHLTIGFMS